MNHDQLVIYELREALKGRWPHPDTFASWAFTVTELSEVGDILLRMGYVGTFVRNRKKPATKSQLELEIGQTLMMLATLANHLGINLSTALLRAARRQARKFGEEIFTGPVRKFRVIDGDDMEIVHGKTDLKYRFDDALLQRFANEVENLDPDIDPETTKEEIRNIVSSMRTACDRDEDRTVVFNLELWQNAVREEIAFRLEQMGFATTDVKLRIPLQAFWTALEAAIGTDQDRSEE